MIDAVGEPTPAQKAIAATDLLLRSNGQPSIKKMGWRLRDGAAGIELWPRHRIDVIARH